MNSINMRGCGTSFVWPALLLICCCFINLLVLITATTATTTLDYDVHLLLSDIAALIDFEDKKFHVGEKEVDKKKGNAKKLLLNNPLAYNTEEFAQMFTELKNNALSISTGQCHGVEIRDVYLIKFDKQMAAFLRKHLGFLQEYLQLKQLGHCAKTAQEAEDIVLIKLFTIGVEQLKILNYQKSNNNNANSHHPRHEQTYEPKHGEQKHEIKKKLLMSNEKEREVESDSQLNQLLIPSKSDGHQQEQHHHEYILLQRMLEQRVAELYDAQDKKSSWFCGLFDCLLSPKENDKLAIGVEDAVVGLVSEATTILNDEASVEKQTVLDNNHSLPSWAKFSLLSERNYIDLSHVRDRSNAYEQSKAIILKHNKEEKARKLRGEAATFQMGLNKFADWTRAEMKALNGYPREKRKALAEEEAKKLKGSKKMKKQRKLFREVKNGALARDHVDWRANGIVSPIKDQGRCGTCWAFASMATLESQVALKNNKEGDISSKKHVKKIQTFSEQQCMDCADKYDTGRCNGGGWPEICYSYYADSNKRYGPEGLKHGAELDRDYPYLMKDGICHYDEQKVAASITDWEIVTNWESNPPEYYAYDEQEMKHAVDKIGPVAACIDVTRSWSLYKSGVFYDPNCSDYESPDYEGGHCIEIVGYGTDNATKQDYWIVKNSWGADWGDNGFILMSRNRENNCLIGNDVTYPIVG